MKQIIQSLDSKIGIELAEVPVPKIKPGYLIVKTKRSLVSLGTERMLVEFGNASLFEKARKKPDQVIQVLDKIKTDGFLSTYNAVKGKLDQVISLGYCNVGEVIESEVDSIRVGDRVASNGPHAEFIRVPEKLVTIVPENITDDEAAFTVIGSIGLQGIRLVKPTFGETIVVVGLGLVGLITIQLLKAMGVKVISIDVDEDKCSLSESFGVKAINASKTDVVKFMMDFTNGIGADGVIITAATSSNKVISQVAQMSRQRGRIVLVGVIGLNINRADFYEKELTFQVSCSYGPGRYDKKYEEEGIDYPLPFVRWTEKRNFEAVLQAISDGNLDVMPLITEKVNLEDYQKIYNNISSKSSIASILKYSKQYSNINEEQTLIINKLVLSSHTGVIGIIGSGNFTKTTLLPSISSSKAQIKYISSSGGISGTQLAKKYDISISTTDYKEILNDNEIDTVIIVTKHDSHAQLVIESIQAGKNVFVEKPLALNYNQLNEIIKNLNENLSASLMVGFNRRFSPHLKSIRSSLKYHKSPININATMNAGFIQKDHWVHDLKIGGGRIIGEACHLIDVCVFLTGSLVKKVCANNMGETDVEKSDNVSIILKFENGSNASINYFSNGSKKYDKERVEVYSQESTWIMKNYRRTEYYGGKRFKTIKTKSDKGHQTQFHSYIDRIKSGGKPLIPLIELINVTRASFAVVESLTKNKWVTIENEK
ncbi:MAG: dehydrogenase [Candidatus Marinimicrobia bacterium]|nr:dehydrogenase [Candidatus Neomarinimicrobiota bacterium]